SSSVDGEIRLWSFPDGKLLSILRPANTPPGELFPQITYQAIAVAENASLLLCFHSNGFLTWTLPDGKLRDDFKFQAGSPRYIQKIFPVTARVTSDGKQIVVGGSVIREDGYGSERITIWSVPSGELLQSINHPR